MVRSQLGTTNKRRVALIGTYCPESPTHQATLLAIQHVQPAVKIEWIASEDIDSRRFGNYAGFWLTPGAPHKIPGNVLRLIKYARENNVPCLGTCRGFQDIVLEYTHHVLGMRNAEHAEYKPLAVSPLIELLKCCPRGKEMPLQLSPDSRVAEIYGRPEIVERYYCQYGMSAEGAKLFAQAEMQIVGRDSEGEPRVVELLRHPFFVGTLFVPQVRSSSLEPHPLISAFFSTMIIES